MSSIKASNLFEVNGLVAVITGGGSGIGLMMAKALAENGASRIYITGRLEDELNEAAGQYPNIVALPGDVTSQANLLEMAAKVKREVGNISLLIVSTGMMGPSLDSLKPRHTLADFVAHAWKSSTADFSAVYELNCTAMYYTILAFLDLLNEGNKTNYPVKSQVIAIASTASFLRNPRAGFAYLSSKAAVISMIKSFSTFCVPWGIRFNAVAAGLFPSELSEPLLTQFKINKSKALTEEGVFSRAYLPAERAGSKEDMAGTVLYLTSRAGSFCNGTILLVDVGKLATMPATY